VCNIVVTPELPRRCSWLHWSLLTPFMRVVQYRSSYGVLGWRYKNTCCNYGKIRSYAAANTFYPSKKICSRLLNSPNSFIWLERHFRPIYFEEITKIELGLLYSRQFWYILMALRWATLVSRVFIEDMHLGYSRPHHCTILLIPPNHQFRVPSFAEINFFFLMIIITPTNTFFLLRPWLILSMRR